MLRLRRERKKTNMPPTVPVPEEVEAITAQCWIHTYPQDACAYSNYSTTNYQYVHVIKIL